MGSTCLINICLEKTESDNACVAAYELLYYGRVTDRCKKCGQKNGNGNEVITRKVVPDMIRMLRSFNSATRILSSKLAQTVTFQAFIRKVLGSNIGRDTY